VIRALFLASVGLGMLASSAAAVDWRIRTTLTETLEFNDNRAMRPDPPGNSYGSISSLVFGAEARQPTSRFDFGGNLTYRTYAGPAERNTKDTLDKSVNARFEKSQKLTTYNVVASWSEFDTATAELEELGTATRSGTTVTTTVGGGLRHQLNVRDSLALQTTWSSTDPSDGTKFESLTSNVDLVHKATSLTDLTSSLTVQQLSYQTGAEVMFSTLRMGMRSQPTRRLTVTGRVGVSHVDAETGPSATTPAGLTTGGGSALDWLADVIVAYEIDRRTRLGLNAARSIGPDTFGRFSKSETVGASLFHELTRWSTVSLAGSFSQQTFAAGGPTETLAASIGYGYQPAREWRTQTSYRYSQRRSGGTSAESNSVLFVAIRDFVLMP
jgi:hypothetical protein